MKQIGVGIAGFGTVGAGVVDGLAKNRQIIKSRLGIDLALRRIGDLDTTTDRGVRVDPGILTNDAFSVVDDPSVDIVVELIGGTGIAKKIVTRALSAGKAVVTANKKLLAECGAEIFSLASQNNADIYFGAAVGGGIPIIRVLREGLVGNTIRHIHGILNGTCNYILTRMENEHLPFEEVLKDAQRLGYAEADPSLDIDGFDTAHKALILAALSYGVQIPVSSISVEGIRGLDGCDVAYAAAMGYKIKLIANVSCENGQIKVFVAPMLVGAENMLSSVSGVFNAVMVNGDMSGDTLYYGRGAGREPTASTVIGDIADIAMNLASGYVRHGKVVPDSVPGAVLCPAEEMKHSFYIRLDVIDSPGSLGKFAAILGDRNVSIDAVIQQKSHADAKSVPVVVLTHKTVEADLDRALAQIEKIGVLTRSPVKFRILGE